VTVPKKWQTISPVQTKAHRSEAAMFRWLREQAPEGEYRIEVDEGTGRWQWFCDAVKVNGHLLID
jgi:hypothetical protein